MKISNASLGERFFGLHMAPGVAEYHFPDSGKQVVFINENTIKKMDASFVGRPVYVEHIAEPGEINEADGVVVKSFYNEKDGKHWVEFMVITDRGKEAIKKGWRLSNAYHPRQYGEGGMWHGVTYQKEVLEGEYEHLAIVPNPRYDESVIMTAEQFKHYNSEKETELKRLANSKGEKSVFTFFNKTKVENSAELESKMVTLPTCKLDKSVAECVTIADKYLNMNGYANPDHMVKAGDEEMSVNDLAAKYCEMKNEMEMAKKAAMEKAENDKEEQPDQKKGVAEDKKDKKEEEAIDKKSNDEMDGEDGDDMENKKSNEDANDKIKMEKKENDMSFFNDLYGAPVKAIKTEQKTIVLDQTSIGKSRYGSN